MAEQVQSKANAWHGWSATGRVIAFLLASASIWCLLAEMYGLCSMRAFTFTIFGPATLLLIVLTAFDYFRGDRRLYRGVIVGAAAGLLAAFAYDIFRLPFVFADKLGIESIVPHLA